LLALAALVPGALAAGCSSYSPDLGDTPFFCGTDKPQCPDGYTCMAQGSASICVASSATLPDASGSGGCQVIDQNLEPNNTAMDALDTTVETNRPQGIDFAGLAVCPAGDVDYYSVEMNANDNLDVTVTDDPTGAPLHLLIETATATLAEGSPVGANKLHAYVGALPAGQYYVVVQAAAANPMGTNTYSLEITPCTTPASPSSCPAQMMGSGSGT
jgi:hypothetical protein